jgi:hypothetical protein
MVAIMSRKGQPWQIRASSTNEAETDFGFLVGFKDWYADPPPSLVLMDDPARHQGTCPMRGSRVAIADRKTPGYYRSPWGYEYALSRKLGQIAGRIAVRNGGWCRSTPLNHWSMNPSVEKRIKLEFYWGVMDSASWIKHRLIFACGFAVAALAKNSKQASVAATLEIERLLINELEETT